MNPFKDRHPSQSAASNFDGGPLYGVHERDNWLLSKDQEGETPPENDGQNHQFVEMDDEVHRSKPNI